MLWYIYCTDRVLWCGVTVCDMLWYIYCTEECCGVTVCDMLWYIYCTDRMLCCDCV